MKTTSRIKAFSKGNIFFSDPSPPWVFVTPSLKSTSKRRIPKNECHPKNEDKPKNEDNLKSGDNISEFKMTKKREKKNLDKLGLSCAKLKLS